LLPEWNKFDAECSELVFDGSQFIARPSEFHSECSSLASESNLFYFDSSRFDARGNRLL